MKVLLAKFWADDKGATAIEYALIATLMSVGLIASMGNIRDSLSGFFEDAANSFDG
ncbi:Flp family type IVb pilin [Hyphomicrobium sp.]|uniref:Flp family type IVb pilin n=1 Tax=Hyphomicrobium sp. TaxID=82 RepID=UPI003F6F23F8